MFTTDVKLQNLKKSNKSTLLFVKSLKNHKNLLKLMYLNIRF